MSEPATYVYCLIQSARAPSVKGAPEGMPGGGPARALSIDRGIWAIVADAPLERFSGERLQDELQDIEAVSRHALAHASVIEFFFRQSPVIPLKLFTLFSHDERVRRQLGSRGSKLRAMFARLRGLEEWGVRITASTHAPVRMKGSLAPVNRASTITSGRDYLEVKKKMKDQEGSPSPTTKAEVAGALRVLTKLAARMRKERFPPPGRGRPYVVGASFLVKAKRRGAWRTQLERLAVSLDAQGHRVEVSGPWPPYHFASGA